VKIDLSKAQAGKQSFLIPAEDMRLPRNVKLIEIMPPGMELTLAGRRRGYQGWRFKFGMLAVKQVFSNIEEFCNGG
jgi:hypothetical protein